MKKIILFSIIFIPITNFVVGLALGLYDLNQPAKIIVSLIVITIVYVVLMYFLLKSKNQR